MPRNALGEAMKGWNGLATLAVRDEPAGAWIFIALHDDTLGPPVGGTRIRVYARPEDGVIDAQRLAEGMTFKWAAVEIGCGGGKAVLALSRPVEGEARRGLLARYGRLVESLEGKFATGQDLGTTPEDMAAIAGTCSRVHGYDPATGTSLDPGPFTARGVVAGIRAALAHRLGDPEPRGRTVLVQGVGGVGAPLAGMLAEAGARLLIADADAARATRIATELGAAVVPADAVYDTACDVYAPCAIGQTLDERTIPRLRATIVAGSANNQLATPDDAERLHRRGILYAPDYVVNAGGATAFGLKALGEADEAVIDARLAGLGTLLGEIFTEAERLEESPLCAAERRVERVLAAARAKRR